MLFEKLVEQHRVHCLVAHAVGLAFFVAHQEIRIHFFHVLGHQSELWNALRVYPFLVMERDWLKRKERFAGPLHWLNLLFEAPRRGGGAKLAVGINENSSSSGRPDTEDVA